MLEMGILDPTKVTRLGAAERGFGRRPAAHDRSDGRRGSEEGRAGHGGGGGGMGGMGGMDF